MTHAQSTTLPPGASLSVYRTVIADWEGAPELRPVSITVPARTREEALEAASDVLQAHFGSSVEALARDDIERDWWFGLNDTDPFLRVCAVIVGDPILDDPDKSTNELR